MIMYLLDKQQRIIKAIDKVIIEANMIEEINTANQLTFSVMTNSRIDTAIQYVCIPAPRGDVFLMFKLISETVKNDRVEYTAIESAYDELKAYSYIKDMRPSGKTAGQMLAQVIQGTRWSLGYIADTNQSSTSFYYITVLEAIQKIVELFNVELTFDVNIDKKTNVISSRRINLYTQQGERTGKRFEYGSNLLEVTREQSSENLITALVGRGKGEEVSQGEDGSPDGYGRRITFTDVEWKKANGNPTDKPIGQEYVEDKDATALYGFSDGRPRIGLTTFEDITDPQELLKATWASLQIAKRPQVAFKASVLDVGDLGLGDTVAIIRHDLGIEYFTRVYKVEHDLLNKANNTIELGDDFSQKSLTNYVADVAKIAENVKNTAEYAVSSASGKNKNYYSKTKPQYANEGDNLFLDLGNGETELYAWHNGNWELIVSSSTSQEVTKKIDELMADAQAMSDHATLVDKQITDWTNELGSLTDYAQNLFKQVDATSNKLDGLTIDTKNLFNQVDKTRQADLNAINQRFASMAKDTEKAIQDSTSIKVFSGDLDDLKNSGTYKGERDDTQHTPPNVSQWYVVSVDAYSPYVVLQTYTDIISKSIYTRQYYGAYGWSSWVKYYNSDNLVDRAISNDLNDYVNSGWYNVYQVKINAPDSDGTLQVLRDGARITQIYDSSRGAKRYIRYKYGQRNWTDWQDFASTKGVSEMYDSKFKISKKEIEADFAHTISDAKTEITTNYMSAIKASADSASAEFSKQITDAKNLVAKDYTAAISVSAEQLSAMFNKSLADQKKTISESYTSAISASAEGLKADYLATIKNAKEQLTTDYNHSISVSADASKELFQKTITDTKNAITNDYIAAITKTASSLRASFSEQITQTNNTVDSLTNYPLYNGDLNNLKKTGIWKTDGNTKNKANNGPYGVVKVDAYSSYIVVQTYYDTTNGFSYVRRYYGNAEWDNWKRLSNENDLSNLNNAITTSYKSAIEATSRSLTSAYQKEITDSKNNITTSYTSAIQQTASALRGEVTQKLGAYVTTTTFNAKASGWDSGVKEAKNGVSQAETHITQLKDDINLRFLEKGKVVSQINLDSSGVLIDGKKVHITGQTLIDNAAIQSAKIASLDANKLTVNSTLDASKVHVINLDANNITANRTNFIKSAWNSISGYVNIDGDGIAVGSNRSGYVKLSENGIFLTHHYNNELVGHIGTNNYAKEEWRNGLEFGLQYPNGDFMSWGVQKQQDGPYIDVMTYNRNDGTSVAGNFHLGNAVTFGQNVVFNSNIYGQGTTSQGSSHLHFQDIRIGNSNGLALLNDNGRGIWIGNNGNVGINATGSWLGFQGLKLPTEITPDGKISKWISL
ncbi:phage tail spike protein [Ligilactobacillus agilis]|uniref:phage tail spike protein n=1 Tax=Ligilactobacillus agilis TaxID=1601 RepID=UPI00242B25E2|nr:phage tail spike protein [Ligilactobacillus agilis]